MDSDGAACGHYESGASGREEGIEANLQNDLDIHFIFSQPRKFADAKLLFNHSQARMAGVPKVVKLPY